jgi:glycosyltransferase involved in cell wall biosynthesis
MRSTTSDSDGDVALVSEAAPFFTVFTPTFDRARTLPRVYESLCRQTWRDFEWLVVDDGSRDGTEELVRGWMESSPFAVRYLRQSNLGKHVAFNRAVAAARGLLFVPLDSDDACVPEALERLRRYWLAVPVDRRDRFSGITVLCRDLDGRVLGSPFPVSPADMSPIEMLVRHRYEGDKWGFHRTEVLRDHPFPEIPGERFIAEGVVWNRVARRYLMRFVNDPLLIVDYQAEGLSAGSIRARVGAPRGAMLYYREFAQLGTGLWWQARGVVNYVRFALHAGDHWLSIIRGSGAPLAAALMLLPGMGLWLRDRWHLSRCRP